MSGPAAPIHSILFLCTLNSVRSPMAEGLARRKLGQYVHVESAGLIRSERNPFALAVLREIGIDFSEDVPHAMNALAMEGFDLVVTLSDQAQAAVIDRLRFASIRHIHWSIHDPTEAGGSREARLQAFRSVRDDLRQRIRRELLPLLEKSD
ncbi:MAG TPA: arsenate reductase ArsC [Beijerinckiaceae bacterium]|nr:arsenate reductase ArsC [Beijerinckiaceae bacterium]